MPTPEEIAKQHEILDAYRRRLAGSLKQQAQLGTFAPPHVAIDIGDARSEIRRIKATLRGWGAAAEDHPDDEPTNDGRSPSNTTARTIPTCPQPNAAILFGRDETIAELTQRLTIGESAEAISAVRGLPGVGKIDLLRAV